MHELKLQGKSHDIPKRLIWEAWLKVEENGGAAGPDGVSVEQFAGRLQDNLYKVAVQMVRSCGRPYDLPEHDRDAWPGP